MNPVIFLGGLLGQELYKRFKSGKDTQAPVSTGDKTADHYLQVGEESKKLSREEQRYAQNLLMNQKLGMSQMQAPDMSQVGMMAMQGMPSPMQIMQMNQREQMRKQPFQIQTTKMRPTRGGGK